jgi:5'-3' exonuclease
MGIPYYFFHLTKKYRNIILSKLPSDISIYAIDFNGIIHPEAHKELHNQNKEGLYTNLWNKIVEYEVTYKPEKMLICVDGVAPLAKIIQQRKRRYLSIYKNKIDDIDSHWDTNAISAGTEFMNQLDNFINKKIINEKKTSYIFDGSKNPGEGEHKIFNYFKDLHPDKNLIINGLDADLIILSLLSGLDNIYLMRENNDEVTYVSISNLKEALLNELRPKWNMNDTNIIESYCVMCSILGNDFIPHILTLNMKNGGLNSLIDITTIAIKEHITLVSDGKINKDCLTAIFTTIASTEETDLFNEVSKFIHKKPSDFKTKSSDYGLKNKDELLQEIYSNNKKWRYNYYKSLFDININFDSSLISVLVSNYIKGIYWTYSYYKKFDLDYEWFYPYNYPPTARDISNYLKVNDVVAISKNGDYLHPYMQLLLILPIQSNHLLEVNEKLKILTVDSKEGLTYLYPKEFKIQTFLKTQLHECSPILPMINIRKISAKINNICR